MSDVNFLSRIRRRLRFKLQLSLRSLLLLIAVAAIGVQFWLVPLLRQRAREATLKHIADAGGQWVALSSNPESKRLLLSGQKVDDELMYEIASQSGSLPELAQLDLFRTQVTDAGWEAITRYSTHLKHMVIFENKISEQAINTAVRQRKDLLIERRAPDPVAAKLAMAPIPPAAIVSLVSIGTQILAGAGDGRLHVLDWEGQRTRRVVAMHDNWLFDIALSPQGNLLATAGGDNQLAIWSYPELELVTRLTAHEGDLHGLVWLDDSHLATVSDDRSLSSWGLSQSSAIDGQKVPRLVKLHSLVAHEEAIPRIRISADRRRLVTASRDDRLTVWSVEDDFSFRQTAILNGHTDDCMDVQFDPTGKRAMSVGYDGMLIAWDVHSGNVRSRHKIGDVRLFCLDVDWDRTIALVGSEAGLIEFDWASGRSKSIRDQPFVSRIVREGITMYTSDGFGSLVARNRHDMSPVASARLFEKEHDHYSDAFFRPL